MPQDFSDEQTAVNGMIKGLLGYSIRSHSTDNSYILRNYGFPHILEQLKSEGWDRLAWIDCDPFDDGSQRFLLSYSLTSEHRQPRSIKLQVMINGSSPWYSLARLFDDAAQLEDPLASRLGFTLTTDSGAVEAGRNREIAS